MEEGSSQPSFLPQPPLGTRQDPGPTQSWGTSSGTLDLDEASQTQVVAIWQADGAPPPDTSADTPQEAETKTLNSDRSTTTVRSSEHEANPREQQERDEVITTLPLIVSVEAARTDHPMELLFADQPLVPTRTRRIFQDLPVHSENWRPR